MSKLFEIHPLPWSVRIVGGSADYLVDALGKEILLSEPEVRNGIKEMTAALKPGTKRRLGGSQKSNQLFVIKDTTDGTYYMNKSITRTQHFRSRYQAQKRVNRLNGGNNLWQKDIIGRYVVVELKVEEKTDGY